MVDTISSALEEERLDRFVRALRVRMLARGESVDTTEAAVGEYLSRARERKISSFSSRPGDPR